MKLQDLNRSLAKVLAASAVAFMIQTGSAQAQQGLVGLRTGVSIWQFERCA